MSGASAAGRCPRVLLVSHNVLGGSTAMGKTMASLLANAPAYHLAQVYFHSEVPTSDACSTYFRITDVDVLHSIFGRGRAGHEVAAAERRMGEVRSRTDKGALAHVYQLGRRRTPLTYAARGALWRMGHIDEEALLRWARAFAPDVILFAAGDYAFAYDVVTLLTEQLALPVVLWCMDDYYLGHSVRGVGRRMLMGSLFSLKPRVASVIVISEKMQRDYGALFDVPIRVVRIGANEPAGRLPWDERSGICYVGGLGVGRLDVLLAVGKALARAGVPGCEMLRVYTGDENPRTLERLRAAEGIEFLGALDRAGVERVQASTRFLLLVESSEPAFEERTRYSCSTKIGEYLASGACVVCVGPPDIASVEYLRENGAALVADDPAEVPALVRDTLSHGTSVADLLTREHALAQRCHNAERNLKTMGGILCDAARGHGGLDETR